MAPETRFMWPLILFSVFLSSSCLQIDLNGQWDIVNSNSSINVRGTVPGSVHMALLSNDVIDEPYFRFNDVSYRWIAYDNWTYSRTFTVSDTLLSKAKVVIVCDGLDTVSDVIVNGVQVGSSNNMFMRYVFDIKNALNTGINKLVIRFISAIHYAAMKSKEYGYDVPPDCSVPVQRGECHRNFIRKEQSSFSWDWGPAFVPQGIWRDISVEGYDDPVIRDVKVKTTYEADARWVLHMSVVFDSSHKGASGLLYVSIPDLKFFKSFKISFKSNGKERIAIEPLGFAQDEVEPWWPRGYGSQRLYNVKLVFEGSGKEKSQFSFKTGFREVKLVQEAIKDSPGLSFYFEINKLPMFLKGANWIPADSFEDRVNASVIRNLLQSAVDSNMNVVRNWGGGIYQHDVFYSAADELGLLVWEEFMFACSMYPTNSDFLNNIKQEAIYQIERLSHHPSVFVWSGNNENEIALAENWYNTNPNKSLYVKDYIKLYIDTIQKTVKTEDTGLPFIVSSPSNGLETKREGWASRLPNSAQWGDVHFYNYTMDCWNVAGYPKPRFASEYGFQSLPSFETLSRVSLKEDWDWNSKFMDHRQHHANGNMEMMNAIKEHFKVPDSLNSETKFKNTLFLSQVAQAMCIKVETEHYRRLQSQLINGQGKTMGAIYWQLNSIWQSPSWSSLEYGGKWKVLHYFAKNFFSDVIPSAFEENNVLFVFVVSDLTKPIVNGFLVVSIRQWDSFKVLHQWKISVSVKRQSSQMVFSKSIADILKERSCASRYQCVLSLSIMANNGTSLGPTNTHFLSSLSRAIGLRDPGIKVGNVKKTRRDTFAFDVIAESPAPFVWISSSNIRGRFSDNGFLLTDPSRMIEFYPWEDTTLEEFSSGLRVMSLYDTYRKK